MKSIKMTAGALALALSAAIPLALAQGGAPSMGGGYGDCPGMMGGGSGMGPGMMKEGAGSGMMGMGPYNSLNLSEEQRSQVSKIQDQVRKQHWDLMGKMREESIKLRNMMTAEKPDPAAVGKQQMRVADFRRQMLESGIDAHNRINALLTPEQRTQLRSDGPGRMMGEE